MIFVEVIILYCLFGSCLDIWYFCYYWDNFLVLDVLVVDEVSMIDLEMMVSLFDVLLL